MLLKTRKYFYFHVVYGSNVVYEHEHLLSHRFLKDIVCRISTVIDSIRGSNRRGAVSVMHFIFNKSNTVIFNNNNKIILITMVLNMEIGISQKFMVLKLVISGIVCE